MTNKMADASWNLPRAKDELWLADSDKIALQVAEGMLHASNSLHTAEAREIWIDQSGFSRREKF